MVIDTPMYKYNKPVKKVWTTRLSPLMRAPNQPWIRSPLVSPIGDERDIELGIGLGDDGTTGRIRPVKPVRPRNRALWSDIYRIGAAGALSRVRPFGPNAFSGEPEMPEMSLDPTPFLWGMAGAIILLAAKQMLT